MVDPKQFRPKGGDGPPEGVPFSHAEVVGMLREMGAIPEGILDENIFIDVISPWGTDTMLTFQGERSGGWREGDPFPHTTFSDPPFGVSPEGYKDILLGTLREAANLGEFTAKLIDSLGRDMIVSHDVPEDKAAEACTAFAAQLYEEYGDAEPK